MSVPPRRKNAADGKRLSHAVRLRPAAPISALEAASGDAADAGEVSAPRTNTGARPTSRPTILARSGRPPTSPSTDGQDRAHQSAPATSAHQSVRSGIASSAPGWPYATKSGLRRATPSRPRSPRTISTSRIPTSTATKWSSRLGRHRFRIFATVRHRADRTDHNNIRRRSPRWDGPRRRSHITTVTPKSLPGRRVIRQDHEGPGHSAPPIWKDKVVWQGHATPILKLVLQWPPRIKLTDQLGRHGASSATPHHG
jgi:hypothetical protein